jgi:GxxExxY protein
LGAAFKVQNTLGAGFSLSIELRKCGLTVESQKTFPVQYEGIVVGDYIANLVVSAKVVVECKAVGNLDSIHEAQLMNYLKASGLRVGLLINFACPKLQFRRLVV